MKKKLIPKGQSGWTAYLNPKNWGVKDYTNDTFTQAFNQAEAEGQKEFLWRGNRYAVKKADKKDFNEQLEWFKNYIGNYKPEDVQLNYSDSMNAHINADREWLANMDTVTNLRRALLSKKKYIKKDFDDFENKKDSLLNIDNIKNSQYNKIREAKLDTVRNRLNNLDFSKIIWTTQPDPDYNVMGWYNTESDSLYASNNPGTLVHELSHLTKADELKNLQPTKNAIIEDAKEALDVDFAMYLANPYEMNARYIQNTFLREKGLPVKFRYVDNFLKPVK